MAEFIHNSAQIASLVASEATYVTVVGLIAGGLDAPVPDQGYFVAPTILADVDPDSTVAQEEIFGPVLVSMTFRTPAEAVALANNTRYGLAASV